MSNPFKGIKIEPSQAPQIKRRYSVTSDVVSFRRCARQYGAFRVQNYAPAHQTQLFFGTIIHQVLDRCHTYYRGDIDPNTKGQLPDDGRTLSNREIQAYFEDVRLAQKAGTAVPTPPSQIMAYFIEVENGLKSRGIWAITKDLREKAVRILQYFNALEGPHLYGRVKDTEHRLQADRGDYILNGVVDLLVDSPNSSDDPADYEIWDYKGTGNTYLTKEDEKTFEFQMRVYARLYELKHGVRPKQANIYFMNELEGSTLPKKRPIRALKSVSLEPDEIDQAVEEFINTVGQIEQSRDKDEWQPAKVGSISDKDCEICDLRWNCPTPNNGNGVSLRYP